MRKNNLKFTIIAIALCICSLFVLASCKDKDAEIFIAPTNSPKLNYVQGQELDLSEGKLTYVNGKKETEVPLNAEDVSITGYNKDTIGSQTLTITYMEKTTEITVNVIPRIKAEGFESKYFINDSFNKGKGKLVIARDNATTFTVNMNSDKVSLVSFDSSVAGKRDVTVKYTDGSTSYQHTFAVNVYDIGNVTLTTPSKIAYYSHDTELDFSGGYLTVNSTADGGLSKFVDLTADMISGFDISAATKEHRDTPLSQTITVTYGGKTFTYKISITYSGVSLVNELTKTFADIDWEAEDAAVTPEQGDIAVEAITEYYKLPKSQKALVSRETTELLVRATAVTVLSRYKAEFENYSNIIKIGENSSIFLVSSTYEDTLAELAKLKDEDENLNVFAEILRNLIHDFPDVVIAKGKTVEQVVAVHSPEIHEFLVDIFEHLTELYETFESIPDNWTDADLKANESDILVAINSIKSETFVKDGYSYLYGEILSPWRDKNDFLEIIYHYYIHVKGDAENLFDAMFEKVPLPGIMNDWYMNIARAVSEAQWMAQNVDSKAYLADVTYFMYYYHKTMEAAEAIKNSGNQLYLDIYEALNIDYINDINVRVEGYGYFYQCGSMLDSEAFMNLWDKYLTLVDIYATGTLDKTKNDAEFRDVIEALSALSPSELYGFITSLNFLYDTSRGSVLVLEYNENPKNMFIDMLGQYSYHVLNDACESLFVDLLTAMESYSLFDIKDSALADFNKKMADVIAKYNALSPADKQNFSTYYGDAYNKYVNIYNASKNAITNLGEYATSFEELLSLAKKFDAVYKLYTSTEEGVDKDGALGLLVALYERAKDVYYSINDSGNKSVVAALYANLYEYNDTQMSLDNAFFCMRATLVYNIMASGNLSYKFTEDGEEIIIRAWDMYDDTKANEIFLKAVYVLYSQYDKTYASPDKATMISLMQCIRDLIKNDLETVTTFCTLEGDTYYYNAVREFIASALTDSADNIGSLLVKAEIAYISYLFTDDVSYLNTFKEHMAAITADYATAVTESSDKEILDGMFAFYKEIYNKV